MLRPRRSTAARALAFVVALIVLCVSLSAEAKKKKGGAKHKAPATKSKGKGKEALPDSTIETDEASSDEKSSGKEGEDDEKPAAKAPPPPPPEDEEVAAKKPKPKAPPKAEAEEAGGGLTAFRLGVGGRALFRTLSWTDDKGALAPYSLSPGPEASVWFEVFPAAFATDGFAANIGLFGRFDYGFGAASKLPSGQVLTTKYQDFLAGLKIRFPVGNVLPYVAGAYGQQYFYLQPADVTRPNTNYSFIDAGAGVRVQFTPAIDLDVGAAYIYVMNPGSAATEVASPALYPKTTAYGIDATLSLGFRLMSAVGIRVGADFRQIGLATHWRPGDGAVAAGGATNRGITAWGGLEVVFDGVGGGGGGGEEGDAPMKKAPPPKPKKASPEDGEPEPEVGTEN